MQRAIDSRPGAPQRGRSPGASEKRQGERSGAAAEPRPKSTTAAALGGLGAGVCRSLGGSRHADQPLPRKKLHPCLSSDGLQDDRVAGLVEVAAPFGDAGSLIDVPRAPLSGRGCRRTVLGGVIASRSWCPWPTRTQPRSKRTTKRGGRQPAVSFTASSRAARGESNATKAAVAGKAVIVAWHIVGQGRLASADA
jgi:hypothetical protein